MRVMYVLALTGGVEAPSFLSFGTLEELLNSVQYLNIQEFINPEMGERVDVLRVEERRVTVIESHTV